MTELDVVTLSLIASGARSMEITDGRISLRLERVVEDYKHNGGATSFYSKSDLRLLRDMERRIKMLVNAGFLKEKDEKDTGRDYKRYETTSETSVLQRQGLNMTSVINYDKPGDMSDAEYNFNMWGFNHLLVNGLVAGYMGDEPFGRRWELFHLIRCGLDGSRSTAPDIATWSSFAGTFAPDDNHQQVFQSEMYCMCGEVEDLSVGDRYGADSGKSLALLFVAAQNQVGGYYNFGLRKMRGL